MKKYNTVIFDLDGTLADTSEGIYNCYKHTLVQMGRVEPTNDKLCNIIGGPLYESFINNFHFNPDDARKAVQIYRKRYSEKGIYEARIYDGIKELLEVLIIKGYNLCVSTLKNEVFAKIMLKNFEIAQYFNIIRGIDESDKLTKEDLLCLCVEELNISKNETVLIGDSIYDAKGAKSYGIDFIGVTYGFGFKSQEEIYELGAIKAIDFPIQLINFL